MDNELFFVVPWMSSGVSLLEEIAEESGEFFLQILVCKWIKVQAY